MNQQQVRETLKSSGDGLTVTELSQKLGKDAVNVTHILQRMPDTYIDRWVPAKSGRWKYAAVYTVVEVPENAPMPD